MLAVAPLGRAAEFDVRPTPAWVDAALTPTGAAPAARSGISGILTDHQARVTGATVDDYFRRVRKVVSAAGVQNASELSIDFDPSYQRLVLHDVALVRGGARINQLDPAAVRIIEKEPESDAKIYDGQLTALLFLKDVRPGDVIDYAFSLDGANPLLGGRYADEYDFEATVPTALVRHRLLWPAARPLHLRGSARVEHRGAIDVYTWERRNVEAIDVEDATPEWYDPYETVQVSEYGSWSEVAQWTLDLYKPDAGSVAAVAAAAEKIRAEHASLDAQIAAAIRFVQDDIRYLGIEMGRGSHEPRQPGATLAQRYGDCKDKAFLLSLLLQDLGVDSHPALVNTKLRRRLDEYLPSPFVFDHVITQVTGGGRTLWIDGTIADQGGTLATIDTPNDERALVVRAETSALTPIVIASRGKTVIDEAYNGDGDGATLDVTSTYIGRAADELRADLSARAPSEYAKERINRFAADHPRIERAAEPAISDDRLRDVITVRERYLVHRLWKNGEWPYVPRAIEDHLARPTTLIRSMPLAVDFPLDITERVTFRGAARAAADEKVIDTPALHYLRTVRDGVLTYTLRSKKDAVPVAVIADHLAALNEMDEDLAFTFEPPHAAVLPWLIGLAIVVLLVTAATFIAVRRRPLPATLPLAEAPAEVSGITAQ